MSDYPMLKARLVSIHIGKPQTIRDAAFGQSTIQSWTTGFYKEPASGLLLLERTNLVGDGQADLKNHGGPEGPS